MWHCLGSQPASIWYQIHKRSLDLGGLHRAEGKPQVWLPALPTIEEPTWDFQLQSSESIFKREMMQVFPSSLAYIHARKGQFYLRAVRVTLLSFSSSQCCRLKRAIARSRCLSLRATSGVCLGWGQRCCFEGTSTRDRVTVLREWSRGLGTPGSSDSPCSAHSSLASSLTCSGSVSSLARPGNCPPTREFANTSRAQKQFPVPDPV